MSPTPTDSLRRRMDRLRIALFLTAISLPLAGMPLRPPVPADAGEAPLPDPWKSPESFRTVFQRRLGFREEMVKARSLLMVRLLEESPSEMVVVGKRGWLFLAKEHRARGATHFLRSYHRNPLPFTAEEMAVWQDRIESGRRTAAAAGSRFLFVFAPNKETIYPEWVPDRYRPLRPESRLDQLLRHLTGSSPARIVDPRPALRRARSQGEVYYRTDSHWNDLGALAASREIALALRAEFPAIPVPGLEEFELRRERRPGGDLARMIGLQQELFEAAFVTVPRRRIPVRGLEPAGEGGVEGRDVRFEEVLVTEQPGSRLPSALVVRDSFGTALIPYLSRMFSRTVYLWAGLPTIPEEALRREKPEVVIQVMVERRLSPLR